MPHIINSVKNFLMQSPIALDGGAIAVAHFAPEQLQSPPRFNAAACQQHLSAARFGRTLLSAAALPSTQTLLQNNARLFPDGTACVADTQYKGKGEVPEPSLLDSTTCRSHCFEFQSVMILTSSDACPLLPRQRQQHLDFA